MLARGVMKGCACFFLLVGSIMPGLLASGETALERVIEPVTLQKSGPLSWEDKHHQQLDALVIDKDVSIRLEHCSDITISSCELHSIELLECERITLRNCWIHDSTHCGVSDYHSRGVLVEGCRMENISTGVYAVESQHVQVIGNFARNVTGPYPRGQMVQFDNVSGSENIIRGNYAINERGKSHPEDVVSIYMSGGEADSPILIEDNYFTGDPKVGSDGKSKSGSGIMLADFGGTHLSCRRNVIICAGQVGIGIAGGSFIQVEDNVIFGTRSEVANVGLYAWNQSKKPSHDVLVARNHVQWLNHDGERNDWWDGGGIDKLQLEANDFGAEMPAEKLPAPPSQAPMPPRPYASKDAQGRLVVRLPWKP